MARYLINGKSVTQEAYQKHLDAEAEKRKVENKKDTAKVTNTKEGK